MSPLFAYYESRHRYLTILRGVAAICLLPSQCDRYLPIMALFDYFEVDLPLYGIYPNGLRGKALFTLYYSCLIIEEMS